MTGDLEARRFPDYFLRTVLREVVDRVSLMIFSGLSGRRNYFQGVDLAMNTTTRTLLAVPVLSRSLGKDGGKVIAVSTCEGGWGGATIFSECLNIDCDTPLLTPPLKDASRSGVHSKTFFGCAAGQRESTKGR